MILKCSKQRPFTEVTITGGKEGWSKKLLSFRHADCELLWEFKVSYQAVECDSEVQEMSEI